MTAEKRRLDGELRGMQQEIDNLIVQMKNSEEKARKAVADAGQNMIGYLFYCHGRDHNAPIKINHSVFKFRLTRENSL